MVLACFTSSVWFGCSLGLRTGLRHIGPRFESHLAYQVSGLYMSSDLLEAPELFEGALTPLNVWRKAR